MPKLNLLLSLNAYDGCPTNNSPSMTHFKWDRQNRGICADNPAGRQITLAPNQSTTLFTSAINTSQNNTTTYNLSLQVGTTNTYVLQYNSGQVPNFRTPIVTGADATTQITVSISSGLLTFTSTGGTPLALGATNGLVGQFLRVGSFFSLYNQGSFYIVANTATSITVHSPSGLAEGPITLGSNFNDQFIVYSSAGIQVGNKIVIASGFSPAVFGTYTITDVSWDYVAFYSGTILPTQSNVQTDPTFYGAAKQFIYIESDKKCDILINGSLVIPIQPLTEGSCPVNGVFMISTTVWELQIQNMDIDTATIFFASIE
jgi:hypothetical protein